MHRSSLRKRFARLAPVEKGAVAVFAAGVALRLLRAWAGRAVTAPDSVIAGLAARHIAHGSGMALFLPGPGPGGTGTGPGALEAAVGGMLFTLFGESGFMLCLATALFGCVALWALWRWGESATGRNGALLALLAGLSGPPGFFRLVAVPHGAYMAALAFGTLAVWRSVRMATDLRDRREPSFPAYAGLGLLAGLTLWADRLAAPAPLVAGGVLLAGMNGRWKKHWKGLLLAAGAFLAGAMPWLCVSFRGIAGAAPGTSPGALAAEFRSFWGGMPVWTRWAIWPVPYLLFAAAGIGMSAAVRNKRPGPSDHAVRVQRNLARGAAAAMLIFVPATAALALAAGWDAAAGAGDVWVYVWPPVAVLGAVACVALPSPRLRRAATALWTLLAVLQGVAAVLQLGEAGAHSSRCMAEFRDIAAALHERGATALFAPARYAALAFHSGETIAVSDGSTALPPALLRKAELAGNPVWVDSFPGLREWMELAGTQGRTFEAAGRKFRTGLQAPMPDDREWPQAPHRAGAAEAVPVPEAALADGRLDTWLEPRPGEVVLEWTFPEPFTPTAIRLQFADGGEPGHFAMPDRLRAEIVHGDVREERELPVPALETSLGRPYPPSSPAVREIPLPRRPADVLRIGLPGVGGTGDAWKLPWRLAEVSLFGSPADAPDRLEAELGDDALSALRARLAQLPDDMPVYAPRRLSGILAADGSFPPARLGGLPAAAFAPPVAFGAPPNLLPGDRTVCLCVENRWAAAVRIALGAADRAGEIEPCGAWTLFRVPPPDPDRQLPGTRLRWVGDLPCTDQSFPDVDELTAIILGKLDGETTHRNEWLRAQMESDIQPLPSPGASGNAASSLAVRWHEEASGDVDEADSSGRMAGLPPRNAKEERKTLQFVRQLSLARPESLAVLPEEIVYRAGGADLLDLRARRGVRPDRPCGTLFRDGLLLQGIDAAPAAVPSGGRIALTLYWQASGKPRSVPERMSLRLLDADGRVLEEDEWHGIANAPGYPDFALPLLECQPETRLIELPGGLPPGPVRIQIARIRASDGTRIPVKSSQAILRDGAAVYDGLLEILP